MADRVPVVRRPLVIWITQVLVLLFALLFVLFFVATLWFLPKLQASQAPRSTIYESLAVHASLLGGLIALSIGLAKRQRWAWWGSITFAVLLLTLVVASRMRPAGDHPIPMMPILPKELLGAAIGDIVIIVALVAYPLWLWFSRVVRAFFGIQRAP